MPSSDGPSDRSACMAVPILPPPAVGGSESVPLLWTQLAFHPVGCECNELADIKEFGNATSNWANAGALSINEIDEYLAEVVTRFPVSYPVGVVEAGHNDLAGTGPFVATLDSKPCEGLIPGAVDCPGAAAERVLRNCDLHVLRRSQSAALPRDLRRTRSFNSH